MLKRTLLSLALATCTLVQVNAQEIDLKKTDTTTLEQSGKDSVSVNKDGNYVYTYKVNNHNATSKVIPCPFGWSVEANPSVDNSLTYVDANQTLAISVTSITKTKDQQSVASPEVYARVAAEQMQCQIPNLSNLIEGAWSFICPKDQVESIVYGSEQELVLLVISGRDVSTEAKLEEFIKFLSFEAKKRS